MKPHLRNLPETLTRENAVIIGVACYQQGLDDARKHIIDILGELRAKGVEMTMEQVIGGIELSLQMPAAPAVQPRDEQRN